MPYDGNGQWHPPSGTHATPLTPISSAAYNAFQDDNAAAHNSLRPVVSGGTGASNAADARSNLRIATTIETKSADYTAVAADRAKMLVFTSAATLSLTAAATLGSDWPIHVRNESTGDIIIDPDSSETVDGLATVRIPPGYTATIWCDGSVFRTDLPRERLRTVAFTGVSAIDVVLDENARFFHLHIIDFKVATNANSMACRVSLDGTTFDSGSSAYRTGDMAVTNGGAFAGYIGQSGSSIILNASWAANGWTQGFNLTLSPGGPNHSFILSGTYMQERAGVGYRPITVAGIRPAQDGRIKTARFYVGSGTISGHYVLKEVH